MAIVGSDGIAYGDKGTATLSHMHNQIVKSLKKTDLTPEQIGQYEYKRDGIEVILNARVLEQPK